MAPARARPGIFGVYIQVRDLNRSLGFYCEVLALDVQWTDGAIAVLHSRVNPADTLVLRNVGESPSRDLGQAGVTRVLWRAKDSAELDRAQENLASLEIPYERHHEEGFDGITLRDPDGVEFVLLTVMPEGEGEPPGWLYWYR